MPVVIQLNELLLQVISLYFLCGDPELHCILLILMVIKVKIKERSVLARLAAYRLKSPSVAIVFGTTICLWNVSKETFLKNERWVRHELEHVRQYQKKGFFLFLFLYLRESISNGYYKNRFEAEARRAEAREDVICDMVII